jgi:hypothetical protein
MIRVASRIAARLAVAAGCAVACGALLRFELPAALASPAQFPPGATQTGPPPPARAAAPVDMTGIWVSVVTEDWEWRMVTPRKGDYESVPLNAEGRRVADTWDVARDGMCEAYGVGGLMRRAGRLRISWQDDDTLKIESDGGQQTRLIHFASVPAPSGERTLQGRSAGEWVGGGAGSLDPFTGRTDGPGRQRWGSLRVRTDYVRPGWLRRNGVPYSQNAVITENFTRFTHPEAGDWFVVTTTVDDPMYLTAPFTTSSNFKKEPNDSKWHPTTCRS